MQLLKTIPSCDYYYMIKMKTAFFLCDYGWPVGSAVTSYPDVNKSKFVEISLQNVLKTYILPKYLSITNQETIVVLHRANVHFTYKYTLETKIKNAHVYFHVTIFEYFFHVHSRLTWTKICENTVLKNLEIQWISMCQ